MRMAVRTPKPSAIVWLEGTIAEGANVAHGELGTPVPGIKEALQQLAATHDIIVLSAFARTIPGRKRVSAFMQSNALPYSSVWDAPGAPTADVRYDNSAQLLTFETPAKRVTYAARS